MQGLLAFDPRGLNEWHLPGFPTKAFGTDGIFWALKAPPAGSNPRRDLGAKDQWQQIRRAPNHSREWPPAGAVEAAVPCHLVAAAVPVAKNSEVSNRPSKTQDFGAKAEQNLKKKKKHGMKPKKHACISFCVPVSVSLLHYHHFSSR